MSEFNPEKYLISTVHSSALQHLSAADLTLLEAMISSLVYFRGLSARVRHDSSNGVPVTVIELHDAAALMADAKAFVAAL